MLGYSERLPGYLLSGCHGVVRFFWCVAMELLEQGWTIPILEGHWLAEFSSNPNFKQSWRVWLDFSAVFD